MIKAKKKYGQNFLKDESVLDKIIQAMPNDDSLIVEIGPGLGDLTNKLLQKGKTVKAYEIDLELCGYLKKKFEDEIEKEQLSLICDDVLSVWSKTELLDKEYHLVANLPYYIATNLILKALDDSKCRTILVMIQKEVAEKFSATVGEKSYSGLSVLTESVGKSDLLFDVSKESFEPKPKVTSSVLKIEKQLSYDELFERYEDINFFKSFLKDAFSAPRKTLLKNLSKKHDRKLLESFFSEHELSFSLRPHQLESRKYHLLFKKIK